MGYPTDEELRERHPVMAAISDAAQADLDKGKKLEDLADKVELQKQVQELKAARDDVKAKPHKYGEKDPSRDECEVCGHGEYNSIHDALKVELHRQEAARDDVKKAMDLIHPYVAESPTMERCGDCGRGAYEAIHDMSKKTGAKFGLSAERFDVVENAEHYNQGGVECIDALRAVGVSDEPGFQAWLRITCIKYLWRLPHKDKPLEDAKKTRYYLNKLIEELESE